MVRRLLKVVVVFALIVGAVLLVGRIARTDSAPTAAEPAPTVIEPDVLDPAPAHHRGVEAAARRFVAAYLSPDPGWRQAYRPYVTDGLADRLESVPRRVVTVATVRSGTVVAVGVGYAVVEVATSRDRLRVDLVREPAGWRVAAVRPA